MSSAASLRGLMLCLLFLALGVGYGSMSQVAFGEVQLPKNCDNKCRMRHSFYSCSTGFKYYYTDDKTTCYGCSFVSTYRCAIEDSDTQTALKCKAQVNTLIEWNKLETGNNFCECDPAVKTNPYYVEGGLLGGDTLATGMETRYTCQ